MMPYVWLGLTAFFVNIPLGYVREGYPRMSFMWLFYIHASIPLLIAMRMWLHTSPYFIVVTIILAICGQIIGARFAKSRKMQGVRS